MIFQMKKTTLPLGALCALGMLGASPLLHAQPAPSNQAAQNPAIKSPEKMTRAPLAKGATSFTMGEAKARLEKAGYTEVSGLTKDADGLWQARAKHHGQWVKAAVDYKGNVAAE